MSKSGVVIGLDVGAVRVGVARGDLAVKVASPLPAILNDDQIWRRLQQLIESNHAETVVVGLPRDAAGLETAQSKISRDFAEKLSRTVSAAVVLQDESLTSKIAEQTLRARGGFQEQMLRDGTLDSEAAALILADYLEGGRS
ncbi:Holliday junction resolvase RuvX [Candidatus Saccharibacteria bacterium]|nr:Holliday junction resolvase RuvX [Candidatus Saccharibacteria bacterium]